MSIYRKAVVAVLGAVAAAVTSAMSDSEVTNPERVQIAIAGFAAFSVWLTGNPTVPGWFYSKTLTAGVLAALSALGGYLANGQDMTGALWLNVVVAAVTALGVFGVPNEPDPAPLDHSPPS